MTTTKVRRASKDHARMAGGDFFLPQPLMREHLRERGPMLQPCPQLGLSNEKSKVFLVYRRCGMFKYVGKRLVGLPRWGTNIGRSNHAVV